MRRLFLLTAIVCAAYAQDDRASIAGAVTDPAGAGVPNATVRAVSLTRGASASTVTTESGRYHIGFLDPGTYSLSVQAPGFKRFVLEKVDLATAQKLAVDAKLEIGAPTDSVTVSADSSQLDLESAQRGQVIGRQEFADVPNNGRVVLQALWEVAGVVRTTNAWGSMGVSGVANATSFSVNGGRAGENEVLLDGVSDVGGDRQVKHIPSIETIQEARVITNPYDAQYGRTGGGVVSFTTKTGTNVPHGVAWYYYRDTGILQANLWALNRIGQPLTNFHIQDFGFETDGPVYIPKLIKGRNKLFYLFTYEGLRSPGVDAATFTLPAPEMLRGDFSNLVDQKGSRIAIYDPLSTQSDGKGGFVRTQFPGSVIPMDRLNPVALKAASYYPQPTRIGDTAAHLNNYLTAMPNTSGHNQEGARIDYLLGSAHRFHFRYSNTPYKEVRNLKWANNAAEPSGNDPLTRNGVNWSGDWTWTARPTAVFNLRFGLTRFTDFAGNTFGKGFDQTQLGFSSSFVSQLSYAAFPAFLFSGPNGYGQIGSNRPGDSHYDYAYSLQPNLNLVRGAHILKIGFEAKRFEQTVQTRGLIAGGYSFTTAFTQANPLRADASSGNEFASFLLGYPQSGSVDNNNFPAYRGYYYAGFVQDDWKVNARLTVNLGFRYDYEQPLVERYNRQTRGFAFGKPSPLQVPGLDLTGGLLYAGIDGQPRTAFDSDFTHFQPRAGFALRLGQNWAMRGGYGLFSLGQFDAGPDTGFSRPTPLTASLDGGLTPRITLSNPFPEPLLKPIGNSQGLATNLGLPISAQYLDRPLPYSHQASLGFERQLPRGWVAETSYSANFTRRLPVSAQVNNIPTSQLGQPASYYTQPVPNPFAGLLPNNPALNGTMITRQSLLVPFPQYSSFTLTGLPIGYQNYHSMQSRISKRFAKGFTFQATYVISKALEAVSFLNAQDFNLADPRASRLEYRLAQYDTPQRFTAASTYELPIGRGRPIGRNMPRILDYIAGGWQLNGNLIVQAGFPVDFPNAAPLQKGSANLPADQRTVDRWFNTSLWTDPANGKPVLAQAPFTLRNFPTRFPDVRFQTLKNLDASLFKNVPIYERLSLNLRIESYNVANTPWFSTIATTNVQAANFGGLRLSQDNQPRSFALGARLMW
jgi:hypothetical protein